MDQDMYDRGMTMRRQVLGDAHVDAARAHVDDFNRDFWRLATQYGWGETWGDPTLTPRERSILNLGMLAALGKMHEFETHCRGVLRLSRRRRLFPRRSRGHQQGAGDLIAWKPHGHLCGTPKTAQPEPHPREAKVSGTMSQGPLAPVQGRTSACKRLEIASAHASLRLFPAPDA
jgi:carboxymuconolactone decarboxylase family protein